MGDGVVGVSKTEISRGEDIQEVAGVGQCSWVSADSGFPFGVSPFQSYLVLLANLAP